MGGAICACTEREVVDEPRALTPRRLELETSAWPEGLDGDDLESRVRAHRDVELKALGSTWDVLAEEYYVLTQSIAICRHADRLDEDEAGWQEYSERKSFPKDPPLTAHGIQQARHLGQTLRETGKPFNLIVSSPYYRCAQTACCIAEELQIPIHFDQDLGEVFDELSVGDRKGKIEPPFRPPKQLLSKLQAEFRDIEYRRDEDGALKVSGQLPQFPESFDAAGNRFAFVVMKLIQQAVANLASIVIVSHGDALAKVLSMMQERLVVDAIPYASYILAEREVRVMKPGTSRLLLPEPVYVNSEQWALKLHPGIVVRQIHDEEIAIKGKQTAIRKMATVKEEFNSHHHYTLANVTPAPKCRTPRIGGRCLEGVEAAKAAVATPRSSNADSTPRDAPDSGRRAQTDSFLTLSNGQNGRNGRTSEFQQLVLRLASVGRGVCSSGGGFSARAALEREPAERGRAERRARSAPPSRSPSRGAETPPVSSVS